MEIYGSGGPIRHPGREHDASWPYAYHPMNSGWLGKDGESGSVTHYPFGKITRVYSPKHGSRRTLEISGWVYDSAVRRVEARGPAQCIADLVEDLVLAAMTACGAKQSDGEALSVK